jgi:hypothetical protein
MFLKGEKMSKSNVKNWLVSVISYDSKDFYFYQGTANQAKNAVYQLEEEDRKDLEQSHFVDYFPGSVDDVEGDESTGFSTCIACDDEELSYTAICTDNIDYLM